MASNIYIIELENGKYYVGKTNYLQYRLDNHFSGDGSKWTKTYKPIKIIKTIKGDPFDEEKHTLLTMDKYGIDNVRGGSYCKFKLSKHDKEKAQQTIYSILDKCYLCGNTGHFSDKCPTYKNEKKIISINKKFKNDSDNTNSPDDSYTTYSPIIGNQKCVACLGSGISYWSDGIYGECMHC